MIKNAYIKLISPLRKLALREGTAPRNDMRMTRVVKWLLVIE